MAIFSDSLLRPYVQENICAPANFYINCTPGGQAKHVQLELENALIDPVKIYFVVGTNNLHGPNTEQQFMNLIICAKQRFPETSVRVFFFILVLKRPITVDYYNETLLFIFCRIFQHYKETCITFFICGLFRLQSSLYHHALMPVLAN